MKKKKFSCIDNGFTVTDEKEMYCDECVKDSLWQIYYDKGEKCKICTECGKDYYIIED